MVVSLKDQLLSPIWQIGRGPSSEELDIAQKIAALSGMCAGMGEHTSAGQRRLGIANTIGQMGEVTQSTAASAEEGAVAAEELLAQSESMKSTVGSLLAIVGRSRV